MLTPCFLIVHRFGTILGGQGGANGSKIGPWSQDSAESSARWLQGLILNDFWTIFLKQNPTMLNPKSDFSSVLIDLGANKPTFSIQIGPGCHRAARHQWSVSNAWACCQSWDCCLRGGQGGLSHGSRDSFFSRITFLQTRCCYVFSLSFFAILARQASQNGADI